MGSDTARRGQTNRKPPAAALAGDRVSDPGGAPAERRPEKSLQALDKAQNGLDIASRAQTSRKSTAAALGHNRVSDPARRRRPNGTRKSLSKSLKRLKMGSDIASRAQTNRKPPAAALAGDRVSDPAGAPAERRPEKSLQALEKAQNGLGRRAQSGPRRRPGQRPGPAPVAPTLTAARDRRPSAPGPWGSGC